MQDIDTDRAIALVRFLLHRYRGATLKMLEQVLKPMYIEITWRDVEEAIQKFDSEWAIKFRVEQGSEIGYIETGVSGKIVPGEYVRGDAPWRELAKARIHSSTDESAEGELHSGAKKGGRRRFVERIKLVESGDYLEIDSYGVTSKLESALTEAAFVIAAEAAGYTVRRMPESKAKHLGEKQHYDFLVEKNGIVKRVEVKSLWGSDTSKARLIHTKGGRWITSSCRFEDQDIFAVNLWLRTGYITDIAYAHSVLRDEQHSYGLPCASRRDRMPIPEHVHQNPGLQIGDGTWFATLNEVWDLD